MAVDFKMRKLDSEVSEFTDYRKGDKIQIKWEALKLRYLSICFMLTSIGWLIKLCSYLDEPACYNPVLIHPILIHGQCCLNR